jgi:hypothetical protein
MLKLDNDLLAELGLGGLPEEQKQAMLQHIYDTLELRVGTRLANQMTDQQLDEFERFIDVNGDANQAQALQWLEANLPHYKDVVNQVFEELKAEIKQMAPQIMATSMPQGSVAANPAVAGVPAPAGQPAAQQDAGAAQDLPQMAAPVPPSQHYTAPQPGPASVAQPDPASAQPPVAPMPAQPHGADAQVYQFPAQQPPAGPGSAHQDQQAA